MKYGYSIWMRLIVFTILCITLTAFFFSCDLPDENGEASGEESTTEEETNAPDEAFHVAVNGTSSFTMVAPEFPTDGEEEAFMEIRSEVAAMTGVSLAFTDDWLREGDLHDPDAYEILIGQTNYDETQTILSDTSYGSYTIAVSGRKIILAAWSEQAILTGAEVLLRIFRDSLDGQDLVVPRSALSKTQVVDRTLDFIPVVPGVRMDHIYDSNGAIEAIYENATPEHFNVCAERLEKNGYTKYAENARGKVLSAIFTDYKNYTFNVFYEGGYDQLCVTVESYSVSTLPPKEKKMSMGICDTQFAQLGVAYNYSGSKPPQNGMCYIWRLENGKFIILDGGFSYSLGAKNLYETLSEMAIDPDNIVIASWIVSHFHSDHVGTLVRFSESYLKEVEIESMIFNLPTEAQASLTEMSSSAWNRIKSLVTRANPDICIYKAHPGQIYHFANVEIEILYTLEMYAPMDLTYYNTCSLVIDVKFGDFNMIMLGDCSTEANENICKNYGDSIEAEVVQVAHHGYAGGSNALYTLVDPIYVFWPAGASWYSTCVNKVSSGDDTGRNAYFFLKNTRIRKLYVGKAAVVLLELEEDTGFMSAAIYENVDAFRSGEESEFELSP